MPPSRCPWARHWSHDFAAADAGSTAPICGPNQSDPESATSVTNPGVIVEVTSDSTEEYDRGPKLTHYQAIPTLTAIVLVSHRERLIEVWSRAGEHWKRTEARRGARIGIAGLNAELSVDEIYDAAEQ